MLYKDYFRNVGLVFNPLRKDYSRILHFNYMIQTRVYGLLRSTGLFDRSYFGFYWGSIGVHEYARHITVTLNGMVPFNHSIFWSYRFLRMGSLMSLLVFLRWPGMVGYSGFLGAGPKAYRKRRAYRGLVPTVVVGKPKQKVQYELWSIKI